MLFQQISILYFPLSRDFGNLWLRETTGCGRLLSGQEARDEGKKNNDTTDQGNTAQKDALCSIPRCLPLEKRHAVAKDSVQVFP